MNSDNKYLCIYHENCADGFGSAWIVRKALGEENVKFHAAAYKSSIPEVSGYDVIIVDFSYDRETMIKMSEKAKSILVLDHHEGAELNLRGLEKETLCDSRVVFDMNKAGVGITWDEYFKDEEMPQLLKHIQDRDLWKFDIENTRPIQANLFSYPYDFELWDKFIYDTDLQVFARDGVAVERKQQKDIEEFVNKSSIFLNIGGNIVPAVNVPYMLGSDAGHLLLEIHKDAPFAAYFYRESKTQIKIGLRSEVEKGRMNVREIAQLFPGGGGHPNSSGFHVHVSKFHELELWYAVLHANKIIP